MTWGFFSLPSPFSVSVLQPVLQPFPFCLLYNYSTHFKMFTIFVCHHVVNFPQKLWDPLKVEDVIPVPTFLNQSLEGLPFTQKYSSMPAFPRHSPLMNSTIVWLQTLSLRSSMWSSTALLRSSVNEWNAFMTRMIAWGPGGHKDALAFICFLTSTEVFSSGQEFHQPGVSTTVTFHPSTFPCFFTHSIALFSKE